MKWVIPVLLGMLAAFLGYAIWVAFIEDGATPNQGKGSRDEKTVAGEDARQTRAQTPFGNLHAKDLPPWLQAGPVSLPDERKRRWDGLPHVLGELQYLTRGRDKYVANDLQLKVKLNELREAMSKMTPEEEKQLAEYFRACDDPTLKYYLLTSFRNWGSAPYVDAIAEYYEADPEMVGETLQHLMGRTKVAVGAMENLIDSEIDPLRRAKLVARAGFLGAPGTEAMMTRFFDKSKSVDRRQAIVGLAKVQSPEAHQKLFELLDGDFEEAIYLPEESAPATKELQDLRGHAVLALLQNGSDQEIDQLLERSLTNDGNDTVARYIDKFFPTVTKSKWIPKIVDTMLARDKASRSMLMYLSRRAEQKDIPQLEKLLAMNLSDDDRSLIGDAINRLR